jgi:vanillate O-demethylase monooxygenase subunit
MFAKNCWYVAANAEDVSASEPHACQVAGVDLVLYRNTEGKVVAMADKCCHRLAKLSLGRIEGSDIRCMYHGIKFSDQGQCREIPGQDKIPKNFCVQTYVVEQRYSWIWVWIGDDSKADVGLLPDTYGQNPEAWSFRKGDLQYAANFQLLNDNLCDLSHVAYVHETTLGAISGREDWAKYKSTITNLERGVRFDRWFSGLTVPLPGGATITGDQWITYDYILPGILLMDTGFFPEGTAEQYDFQKPEGATPLSKSCSFQAVTPQDERSFRYFFSVCTPHNEPNAVLEDNWAITLAAFMEDKQMIEAQQEVIDKNPDVPLAATVHDQASVYFRRLIEQAAG